MTIVSSGRIPLVSISAIFEDCRFLSHTDCQAKMESVAMAPEGPAMGDFKHRDMSPTLANNDASLPKKTNIRKRTKTGCMSMFWSPLYIALTFLFA